MPPSHKDNRQQLSETAILLLLRRGLDPLQIISSNVETNEVDDAFEYQRGLYFFCANNPIMVVDSYGLAGMGPGDVICIGCIAGLWSGCATGCIGIPNYRDCVKNCVYKPDGGFYWPDTYPGRRCACLCSPIQMP